MIGFFVGMALGALCGAVMPQENSVTINETVKVTRNAPEPVRPVVRQPQRQENEQVQPQGSARTKKRNEQKKRSRARKAQEKAQEKAENITFSRHTCIQIKGNPRVVIVTPNIVCGNKTLV